MANAGWRRVRLAAAAAAAAVLVASCADLPSAGPVQSGPAPQGGSGTTCCALVMSGPQPGLSATDVVADFLLASASFAHGNAIAREYLTPAASRSWSPGSAVTVVGETPTVVTQSRHFGPESTVTVVASGQVVATVTSSGQYQPVTGSGVTAQRQNFVVESYHGEWRIARLPGTGRVSHLLMLPVSFFNLVYKPQNLYFYAQGHSGQVLVPDPVFVPSDSSDPATRLVRALMSGVPAWLEGAATSAFPARARLGGVQVLPGPPGNKTAIVSLSMPARAARPATLGALDAQLVWTLTSRSYGQPLIQSVKLKVNGRFWPASGSAVLSQARYPNLVPGPTEGEGLYYAGADGGVSVLGGHGRSSQATATPVPGAAGQGRIPMKVIAVSPDSPDPRYLAGISSSGTTVYVSDLAAGGSARARTSAASGVFTGTAFSALSWDRWDNLWVAGQVGRSAGVWVLPHGRGPAVRVSLPPGTGPVTALKVAPDGVRVAMVAGRGGTSQLMIGAVVRMGGEFVILHTLRAGANLASPGAMAWYDPDHLLVVTGTADGTEVWEVPVNGNGAVRQGAQPGIVSVAAAGPGNPLYLGLSNGRLARSAGFGEFWSDVTAGTAPTYPG